MFKLIAYLIEAAGWIRIVASPFLIALGAGAYLYLNTPGTFSFVYAMLVSLLGLVIGILWATWIWKKTGTTEFLSRVESSPELNNLKKTEKE